MPLPGSSFSEGDCFSVSPFPTTHYYGELTVVTQHLNEGKAPLGLIQNNFVWGWEELFVFHIGIKLDRSLSPMSLHVINARHTWDPVTYPRQQSKERAGWHPSVGSENSFHSPSPLTCCHFCLEYAELTLCPPLCTAGETEATEFKWFAHNYSAREARDLTPQSRPF